MDKEVREFLESLLVSTDVDPVTEHDELFMVNPDDAYQWGRQDQINITSRKVRKFLDR